MLVALGAGCAHSSEVAPFGARDESPVARIFGLPSTVGASVLGEGRSAVDLSGVYSSNYSIGTDDLPDRLVLDGETARVLLRGRLGLGSGVELGVEVPWMVQSGGGLDGFILAYHQAFGFEQGERHKARNDQLDFGYWRDGEQRFLVRQAGHGLGDLQLSGGLQLVADAPGALALALRGSVKLPLGDVHKLMGSGGIDLALWLSGSAALDLPLGRAELWASLGGLGMTDAAVLKDLQTHFVTFGQLGLGWRAVPGFALKVQLDAHSPFFGDTGVVALGMPAAQLTVGASVGLWPGAWFDLGLVEDAAVMASPDVGVHAALRASFD